MPKEVKDLIKLPGIGAYTAGAIACFGYDLSVSFVDSNIKRILTRLFVLRNPTQKQLERQANTLLNLQDSFNHNQALLDLGALICTAKSPKCDICPLQKFCKGKNMLNKLTQSKPSRIAKRHYTMQFSLKRIKSHLLKARKNSILISITSQKF